MAQQHLGQHNKVFFSCKFILQPPSKNFLKCSVAMDKTRLMSFQRIETMTCNKFRKTIAHSTLFYIVFVTSVVNFNI